MLCKTGAQHVYMSLLSHVDRDKVTLAINFIDCFFKLGNHDWFAAGHPIGSIGICEGELFLFDNDIQG